MKSVALGIIRKAASFAAHRRGCELGTGVILNGFPYIRRRGSGRIIIGDGVTLNTARWANWLNTGASMTLNVEDGAVLELKRGCGVSASQIIANVGIEIGEDALIGAGCLLCDSDMHEVPLGSSKSVAMKPIKIGARAFVGARTIVLKGVTIGEGSVIGAGSVVTRDIPAGVMAGGNPAKVMRTLTVNL
ncbi:acyltransferase [Luteolibacter soli]|uniref:Acyltransferase n=1 Tax=Luteolibacter soli TaxID=3135280 RepID=A0ABU9AV44_9BACT